MLIKNLNADYAVLVSDHVTGVARATLVFQHERFDSWVEDLYSVKPVREALVTQEWIGAFNDGVLVGTGYYEPVTGWVGGIYVKPYLQGHGLGKLILAELLNRMVDAKEMKAVMSVHSDNVGMQKTAYSLGFAFEMDDPHKMYFVDQPYQLLSRTVL